MVIFRFSGLSLSPEDALHLTPFLSTFLPFSNFLPGPSITAIEVEFSGLLRLLSELSCDLSFPGGMRQMEKGQEKAAVGIGN